MWSATGSGALALSDVGPLQVVRVPTWVRGAVVLPAPPTVSELRRAVGEAAAGTAPGPTGTGSYLLVRPLPQQDGTPAGERRQVLVVPAPDPRALPEPDPPAALAALGELHLHDVLALVDALGRSLRAEDDSAGTARALLAGSSHLVDRMGRAELAQLAGIFDAQRVEQLVDRELATTDAPGRAYLDGWGPVGAQLTAGPAARLATSLGLPARERPGSRLRAVPTRQLHFTAGNAAIVPAVSLLWAWASRGASLVKFAADAVPLLAVLVDAITRTGVDHPLLAHTSLVYWPGGETRVEDVVLADGAFDRRVLWGSQAALASVEHRGAPTDTVLLTPRHSLSIVSRDALRTEPVTTVRRAAVDSMISHQAACTASLLHVVEGDATEVEEYCRQLAHVLAEWDAALPHHGAPSTRAAISALRRGRLSAGRWHVNGNWPAIRSAVVEGAAGFDLRHHPGGRLVLVQGVADLRAAVPFVRPGTGVVGVADEPARIALRDDLVSRGADSVTPLGAAEEGYPGRPHDGMRVLSRLVRWVNG